MRLASCRPSSSGECCGGVTGQLCVGCVLLCSLMHLIRAVCCVVVVCRDAQDVAIMQGRDSGSGMVSTVVEYS